MSCREGNVTLLLLWFVFGCAASPTQGPPSDSREVQAIIRSTASPFCPGKTLDSCPSPSAGEWRRDIHRWIADGATEAEVRARLQERVPGFDLQMPPVTWGWLIPTSSICLSTLWFVAMVRRFRGRSQALEPDSNQAPSHACLDERLDRELALHTNGD